MKKIEKKLKKLVKQSQALSYDEKTSILEKIKKGIPKKKLKELCEVFLDEKKQYLKIEKEYENTIRSIEEEYREYSITENFVVDSKSSDISLIHKELFELIDNSDAVPFDEKDEWKNRVINDMNQKEIDQLFVILKKEKDELARAERLSKY